jgi:hypothetical protein
MRLMKKPRMIAFYLAALASLTAIVMIPFYEHWYSVKETKAAWSALSSPELHVWLLCGTWAATFALVGSLFGQGIQRIIAFVLSVAELYFWLVLSIAV